MESINSSMHGQECWQALSEDDDLAWQAATLNMEAFGRVARAMDHATCRVPYTQYEDMTTDKESRLLSLLQLGPATSSTTQLSDELTNAMQYVQTNKAVELSSTSRESVQSAVTCASTTPEIERVNEYCGNPSSFWPEETASYPESLGYDCQPGYDSGIMYNDRRSCTHGTTLAVDAPLSDAWYDPEWMLQPMYDDECEAQFPYGWGNSNLSEVERPGSSLYRNRNFEHCTQADAAEKCRGGDNFAKEQEYLQHPDGRYAERFDPNSRPLPYWVPRDAFGYPMYAAPQRPPWNDSENVYNDGNPFFGSCFEHPQ